MGITGLIPFLQRYQRPMHLRELQGKTVGVDAYVWLHKSIFTCALDLLTNPKGSDKYIDFCIKKINELTRFGIEPFLVFDGGRLPIKNDTELERRSTRADNKKKALEHYYKKDYTKATEYAQKCIDVTPLMAHKLIRRLEQLKIKYIVAPYEADAQLCYLQQQGLVHSIITEDSDLLAFGCNHVIFKLDKNGNGVEISAKDIGTHLNGWSLVKTRHMCILSGCDYLKSLSGVGLVKAEKHLKHSKNGYALVKKWKDFGKLAGAPKWTSGYEKDFERADLTFLHQRVFDPVKRKMVHLNPMSVVLEDDSFLGPLLSDSVAESIAVGQLDPMSLEAFDPSFIAKCDSGVFVPVATTTKSSTSISPDSSKAKTLVNASATPLKKCNQKGIFLEQDVLSSDLSSPGFDENATKFYSQSTLNTRNYTRSSSGTIFSKSRFFSKRPLVDQSNSRVLVESTPVKKPRLSAFIKKLDLVQKH